MGWDSGEVGAGSTIRLSSKLFVNTWLKCLYIQIKNKIKLSLLTRDFPCGSTKTQNFTSHKRYIYTIIGEYSTQTTTNRKNGLEAKQIQELADVKIALRSRTITIQHVALLLTRIEKPDLVARASDNVAGGK